MILFLLSSLLACVYFSDVAVASSCKDEYPHKLDVGIYWAGFNYEGQIFWEKSCKGALSSAFDPDKKTLIIIHGLQPGMVEDGARMASDGVLDDVIHAWFMNEFNVGIFQWTNFADEAVDDFVWAEDKIYSTHGLVKMQYRIKTDEKKPTMRLLDAPLDRSVADYFVDEWRLHFLNDRSYPEIRIMGHSLGTQLAVLAATKIYTDTTIKTRPVRLALLDPVMSPRPKIYFSRSECGRTVAKNMGCMIRTLTTNHSVAIEYYKSSFINRCLFSSRQDNDLVEYTAYATVTMNQWGSHPLGSCWDDALLKHVGDLSRYMKALSYQINMQHIYIVPYYLLTLITPPSICVMHADGECASNHEISLSAAMPTTTVLTYSSPDPDTHEKRCFHQVGGTEKFEPYDDTFYEKPCRTANT